MIRLANQKVRKQSNEPIKTSNRSKGEKVPQLGTIGFGLTSDWMKKWRENFKQSLAWVRWVRGDLVSSGIAASHHALIIENRYFLPEYIGKLKALCVISAPQSWCVNEIKPNIWSSVMRHAENLSMA